MPSPPLGRERTVAATAVGAALLLALPAAAQPTNPTPEPGLSPVGQALAGALLTLVVGGGLIALVPEYTERTTDRVLETPGETFLYGLVLTVLGVVLVFLLAITVVGVILVVPLVVAAVVVGELGYLAAGRLLTDDWTVVLLGAVVVAAFASGVPFLGGLVGFVLGSMGIGAGYLEYRDGGSGGDVGSSGVAPAPDGDVGKTATRDGAAGHREREGRDRLDSAGRGGDGHRRPEDVCSTAATPERCPPAVAGS